MLPMAWGRLLLSRWVVGLVLGLSGVAAAVSLSPEVQQGMTWLQSRVTASGTVSGEVGSVATPLQNRDEALRTLQLLASGSPALANAVAADDPASTEYLARQALSLGATRDISAHLAALAVRQNTDGGIGTVAGGPSSALESAWVLAALSQQPATYSQNIAGLKTFLIGQQWTDGGLAGLSQPARLEGSSLMLLALQALTPDLSTRNSMSQLAAWLTQAQGADGAWGNDLYLTAYALAALAPVSSDGTLRESATTYLKSRQGANGDWANDPFLTAVILRALSGTPGSIMPPATNSVVGQVFSTAGNLPLSGVAVAIDGSDKATTTDAQGKFQLSGVPVSAQTLRFSLAGYQTRTYSITVPSTTQFNLGNVMMSPASATVTTLSGTVKDIDTQQLLAGVTLALDSTPAVSVQTDSAGHYQISNLAAGSYTLTLSGTGYTAQTVTVTLGEGSNLLQLVLRKQSNPSPLPTGPATLGGQVVALGSGQPLAEVQVSVNQAPITTTTASGAFSLTLPAGTYRLDYQAPGYLPLTQNVAVTAGSNVSIGQVKLAAQRSTTRLSGIVTDAQTQSPLAGATVQIVDGISTSTGADGRYVLDNITATQFDVRVSATGYDSGVTRLSVSAPGEVGFDFALQPQAGQGVSLGALEITPGSAGLRTDLVMAATYENAGITSVQIVPTLQIVDAGGQVVSSAVAYASTTATTPLGTFELGADGSQVVYFRWNSGQFPPGTYTALARASLAGSISRSNLLGAVLAERPGSFALTEGHRLTGSLMATPPVQQAGNVQPVNLTAVLQNDGNTLSAEQTLTVRFINEKTGATAHTLTAELPSLAMNGLATVEFGSWSNPPAGTYLAKLVDESGTELGITVRVYVGDAAKGFFTVNKTVVPTGTQTVRANVALQGVDAVTGEITDPLAPLIKTAIQKAVTYNDNAASSWVATNKCGGCHFAAQAMVGGEYNNGIATYNEVKRKQVIGQVVALQNTEAGHWLHVNEPHHPQTHTATSMWGLSSVQDKTPFMGNYVKGIHYLLNAQHSGGNWAVDHDANARWWTTNLGQAALNVHSLITFSNLLKAKPDLSYSWYKPWMDYGPITAGGNLRFDANRNLYVSGQNFIDKITPAGVKTRVISGYGDIRQVVPRANGDLYFASASYGLYRRLANGTVQHMSGIPFWGMETAPNGDIYLSSYSYSAIYKLTNDSVLTHYASAPSIHFLDVGRDGNVYFTQWNSDSISRARPGQTPLVVGRFPGGPNQVAPIMQMPNGNWVIGGTYGGHIMNETFTYTVAKIIHVGFWGVEMLDDKLLFSSNVSGVSQQVWEYSAGHIPAELGVASRIDPALQKAKAWFLAANPVTANSTQERAMQMTALAELQEYLGPDPAIAAKLQSLNTTLRSLQNSNGGWGTSAGKASDPLVTAQVGYALDKLNPSSTDPAIRKAIEWVLSQQAADGSWYSPTLSTRPGTTTWVAIWLPIALNRVGGIDTDLHLTVPATTQLTNPSPAPTSTTTSSDGTHYRWAFTGVTAAGRNVGFDLTLANLLPNEQRAVASAAHLTFNNSFTNSQVTAPLDIPVVTASNGLALTLTTDQVSYGASTPVAISASVGNGSQLAQNGSVHLWVYAQDGTLVSDLGTQPFSNLAPATQQALGGSWNTGAYLPNAYFVQATLYDGNGYQVSTQRSDFTITASSATGRLLGAQVTTDKGSYGPWDTVQVSDRIANLMANALVGDLNVLTQVRNDSNEVVWSRQAEITQLTAGGFKDLSYSVSLRNAAAGAYSVTLMVTDGNGAVQAQSSTTYLVQSSAATGAGLAGTLALSHKQIVKGETQTISVALVNQGNALLEALPVTVRIFNPLTGALVTEWQDNVPVLAVAGTANLSHTWVAQGAYGNLVAVLSSSLTGERALAQAAFTLIKPPLTAAAVTDKPAYDVNETVALTGTVTSAASVAVNGLVVQQQVLRPDGTVFWENTLSGQALAAQGLLTDAETIALGRAALGVYQTRLIVTDTDGIVLAQAQAAFTVLSTAATGAGLAGSLAASPDAVPEGEPMTLALNVVNQGNADVAQMPVELVVTNIATGQVVRRFEFLVDSLVLDNAFTQTVDWTPLGKDGTVYRVALVAKPGSTSRTLAETTFRIIPPPVKFSVAQQWGGQGRVLVYLSCESGDACLAAQQATLHAYLQALGVTHTIVTTTDDFRREFRSGRFNGYWLLGPVPTLPHGVLEEVREAVFRGDSLLTDGGLQRWSNADLYPLLGLTYKGQLACSDSGVRFTAPVFGTAVADFGALATTGRPLNVVASSGTASAGFANSGCGSTAAALGNAYGQGRTLSLAFDLMGSLPIGAPAEPWLAVLRDGVSYTRPYEAAPSALVPGDYLRHLATVTNEAKTVDLIATLQLPAGSVPVVTWPTATVNADGSLSYRFTLPEAGTQALDTQFRVPMLPGHYTLTTAFRVAGRDSDYGSHSSSFSVQDSAVRRSNVWTAIANLAVPLRSQDLNLRKQALGKFELAQQHHASGQLGTALNALTDAGELLGAMTQTNVQEARVALATLLREWEQDWWRQCTGLPAGSQPDATRCGP
jgi:hypothetical protein